MCELFTLPGFLAWCFFDPFSVLNLGSKSAILVQSRNGSVKRKSRSKSVIGYLGLPPLLSGVLL